MSDNPIFAYLQQGFRLTVGATASLVETLQDPQKLTEAWTELQTQWQQKTQEWSEKGEITEQEARQFIEMWLNRQPNTSSWEFNDNNNVGNSSLPSLSQRSHEQAEIQELTEQIVALRNELEQVRQSKGEFF